MCSTCSTAASPAAAPSACGCGCSHSHAAPLAPLSASELASLGQASATRAIYHIPAMDCPMEETLIRSKLSALPGINGLEFNLMRRVLTVEHNLPSTLPIEQALTAIGMAPQAPDQAVEAAPAPQWRKLALAGILAAFSEIFELVHEWGLAGWHAPAWLPMILALAAIFVGGLTTYKKGWIAIRNFNLNINALMSVAVTGAVLIGQFPEAAMVMVLFNLSEAIEGKALDRARNAIKDLLALAPEQATVQVSDGSWAEVDIRSVTVGSRVRVRPGEKIALDGRLLSGSSTVNQAPITGESMPVEKAEGDLVYAGTINESGSFEFEVTAPASDSTLARIIHAVEEAQGSRAPIQRFVDQFARYYTPAVFLTAIMAAVIPPLAWGGAWAQSVYTALVLLVIGCPCALVISTPVSIVSGMAAATRQGILVKGGIFLEQGRKLAWLALDKTGTITHGRPRLTDLTDLTGQADFSAALSLAAGLASRSDHPVSRAIAAEAHARNLSLPSVDDFAAIPGQGVRGRINGELWQLGNQRTLSDLNLLSPDLEQAITSLEQQGKTVAALIGPDGARALLAVADTIKESSVDAIAELHQLGVRTMMLTGDNPHIAAAVAAQVKVDDFRAGLLPQDKLQAVEQLQTRGLTGMVGDGINDAPALARAQIGFAMAAAGTDTAIETADVALMDDDLRKIPRFIRISRATYAILVQNIGFALGIKAVFLTLALTGHATMWMAVFADVGASLLVVANGLRATRA